MRADGVLGPAPARAEQSRARLAAMTDTLRHRGPDDSGAFVDPDVAVALGSRRLAVVDLSEYGHQPMASPDGRYVLAFNGEIYNFRGAAPGARGGGDGVSRVG